ncbi:MAG: hypothetical protein QXK39_01115, partial [Nitrososphaerota archaeon]
MKPQHVGETASEIEEKWRSKRWEGIVRKYTAEDVLRLRGTWPVRYITAEKASEKLWYMLHTTPYVFALGAVTGSQAVQMVEAGFKAIYVSGWQVAADMNVAGQTYPDLGLYPYNSVPLLVKRIVQALQRADQIQTLERKGRVDYFAPIIADGEAGFGGPLHAFELMKSMIEAGAAAVHGLGVAAAVGIPRLAGAQVIRTSDGRSHGPFGEDLLPLGPDR